MSTQAQAPTPFGEESSNSQHDDPLRLIMQDLQSLRDEMRDIRRDVTNLSNQQREFHQPPRFDEELHPPPYDGRRGGFGGRGMPRHFEEVPRPQARHGEPLYDDHEHFPFDLNGWIEKEEDESGEYVEGEEYGEDDEHIDLNPLKSLPPIRGIEH
ncbi:hypothetical protein M9H77_31620 [Catharanthus roseus]|uniref:Uncharacterized protein n=1 Tax=Catharanthus roseus TaxID=4058 RepID=A0ACC0A0N7_CATRO|nr:hypothetical protein M9H77_31620 [Catharanthus roseus]